MDPFWNFSFELTDLDSFGLTGSGAELVFPSCIPSIAQSPPRAPATGLLAYHHCRWVGFFLMLFLRITVLLSQEVKSKLSTSRSKSNDNSSKSLIPFRSFMLSLWIPFRTHTICKWMSAYMSFLYILDLLSSET